VSIQVFARKATVAPAIDVPAKAARKVSTIWGARPTDLILRQGDALERTNHVVGAFFSKEAFVIAGAEIPVRSLVVIVAIKTPDAVYDDETTDPIVPIISDVMEAQVRTCESSAKPGVIVKDQFRQAYHLRHERYRLFPRRGSMITQRTKFPFHV